MASKILGVCQVSSVPSTFRSNECEFPFLSFTLTDAGGDTLDTLKKNSEMSPTKFQNDQTQIS